VLVIHVNALEWTEHGDGLDEDYVGGLVAKMPERRGLNLWRTNSVGLLSSLLAFTLIQFLASILRCIYTLWPDPRPESYLELCRITRSSCFEPWGHFFFVKYRSRA